MMKSKRLMVCLSGLLAGVLLVVCAGAAGTRRTQTIEVTYDNISIIVDGEVIEPKDANGGRVEPFIYNGTTYLPVRAVGSAIGKNVNWDGVNNVVYLGAVPGEEENWMSQCPPYQYTYGEQYLMSKNEHFVMSGKKYSDGFVLDAYWDSEALFNLDGKYNRLSFTVGHIDNTRNESCTLEIWLDGKIAFEKILEYDDVAQKVTIPLDGALQMKIRVDSGDSISGYWGFSEGRFE